jgi:hypothetical protein
MEGSKFQHTYSDASFSYTFELISVAVPWMESPPPCKQKNKQVATYFSGASTGDPKALNRANGGTTVAGFDLLGSKEDTKVTTPLHTQVCNLEWGNFEVHKAGFGLILDPVLHVHMHTRRITPYPSPTEPWPRAPTAR